MGRGKIEREGGKGEERKKKIEKHMEGTHRSADPETETLPHFPQPLHLPLFCTHVHKCTRAGTFTASLRKVRAFPVTFSR